VSDEADSTVLRLADVVSRRGRLEVLHGVSLELRDELLAVFGLNASGKSTLLRTVSGLTPAVRGSILFGGVDIAGVAAHRVSRLGLAFMPQDNQIFPSLSVFENIEVAARLVSGRQLSAERERVLDYFPHLQVRRHTRARHLSGGERQMLALSMVLVRRPRVLLMDEPSAGLAPTAIDTIYDVLARLREERLPILMAEQNVQRALGIADRAAVMVLGRCVGTVDAREPDALERVKTLMMGTSLAAVAS
jgi:branched-chain amino acid transport system ATP-binding protein